MNAPVFIPGYWMNETSGVLAPVVQKYLSGRDLSDVELRVMRAYLRQWMRGDFRGPRVETLRRQIDHIQTTSALRWWFDVALEEGIDPL